MDNNQINSDNNTREPDPNQGVNQNSNNHNVNNQAENGQGPYSQAANNQSKNTQSEYNQSGYNQNGYNQSGYNQSGYNQNGYNQNGYNQNGYNPGQNSYSNQDNQTPYYASNPYPPMSKNEEPMSLKDWLITFLLLMIPFAGIVLPFIWAFGSDVNQSKKTYFQAMLIMSLVGIVLYIIIIIFFFSLAATFSSI
jgi:hypothetical protein